MYKIEKKPFGYKLTFGDLIKADEMKKWVDESKAALQTAPKEFGILIDMRTIKPLPSDSQLHMQEGQKLYSGRPKTPILELPGINQNVKLLIAMSFLPVLSNTVSQG